MKNFWFWLIVVFVFFCAATVTPPVKAQSGVSPNLVYMTTNPWQGPAGTNPGSWTNNFTTTTGNGGGFSGGSQPAYNTTTGTFMFGYSQATIAYTYALSQALKDSGMTWTGYNYSWDYFNQDMSRGTLSANLGFTGVDGTSLYSRSWTLGATTNGWTTMSGTETFTTGALASTISNFKLSFTGKDDRFWAGYYGPQVKDPTLSLNYTFDECSSNPLSSPSCPGYAAAYQTQQCNANPLYSTACPGYQAAYTTQQCSANPLYATDCPNYGEAYAKKNILGVGSTTTTTTTSTTTVSTTEPSVQVRSDGKVDSTSVPLVKDSNVNSVITSTTTSATPSATAAVPLVSSTPQQGATNASVQTSPQAASSTSNARQETAPAGGSRTTEAKTDSKANQQQMKANATEKAKEEMKKASTAATMEAQIATQGIVLGMMSFVPGFDSYQTATIVDINGLRLQRLYGKDVVENRFVNRRLFGGSDRLHQEMVDQQYQGR